MECVVVIAIGADAMPFTFLGNVGIPMEWKRIAQRD